MVRISITAEAFEAVASTIPFGSISFERELNAEGERLIWIEEVWADKLRGLRGPGESYSDVILKLISISPSYPQSRSLVTHGRGRAHSSHRAKAA